MSGKMLTPWERDDIRWKGNPAMERWTRWEDVLTSTATIQETSQQSGQFRVVWGYRERDEGGFGTVVYDSRPLHRTWGVPNFSSVADAKKAVDERLRFMGYVLPEDKVELVMVKGPEGPNITSTLTLQLQQKEAQLQQLTQSLREAGSGWRGDKDWRLRLEEELKDRTKERDALINGKWLGPWKEVAATHGVEMVRYLSLGRGSVVWQTELGWFHTPRLGSTKPMPISAMTLAMQAADQALLAIAPDSYLVSGPYQAPNPALIWCPKCETVHVDEGELAWRPHRTHECVKCKHTWPAGGPGEFWVGVAPASGK